jgi:glucans biosynthesis protein C
VEPTFGLLDSDRSDPSHPAELSADEGGNMAASARGNSAPARLFYLDWLRVFTILAVFLYHSNRFFTLNDWSIKNATRSLSSTIVMEAFNLWIMPLLFTISGAAIFLSLKSRGHREYVKERLLRLLVPLAVLGVLILGPFQVYLERLSHGDFSGNFLQFLPHYFEGLYGFGGNFAFMGVHLWYLMLLFLFSMVALPLVLPSRSTGDSLLSRLSQKARSPWSLLLIFAIVGLGALLADPMGLGFTREMGSWDILSYFLMFLSGYVMYASPNLQASLRKYGPALLVTGIVLSTVHLALLFNPSIGQAYDNSPIDLRLFGAWGLVLGIMGTGARLLNFNQKYLSHANEAVLPFYILHQPVLLSVGYFVVQWSLPIIVKYLIIVVCSLIVILTIYELLVRRVNALRILFGMKASKVAKARSVMSASPGE